MSEKTYTLQIIPSVEVSSFVRTISCSAREEVEELAERPEFQLQVFGAVREDRTVRRSFLSQGFYQAENVVFRGNYKGNGIANRDRSRPFRRYTGRQYMFSLDGYITPDMIFAGDSLSSDLRSATSKQNEFLIVGDFTELPSVDDEYIFLGVYHKHFGHALVESLNRLWFLNDLSIEEKKKAKYVFFGGWGDEGGPLKIFLHWLGVPLENVSVIREDMIFRKLLIPTSAWRPWNDWDIHTSRGIYDVFRVLCQHEDVQRAQESSRESDKIYLTRSSLTTSSSNSRQLCKATSSIIEETAVAHGYRIVAPETLSLAEQLAIAKTATHICGPAGSAHHLAAFAGACKQQLILTHEGFWMGSTDVVFAWDKKLALKYVFGKQTGNDIPLKAEWDIDTDDVVGLFNS